MALITGTVSDIGMQPLSGDLSVSSLDFRPEGDVLVAPEIRSFPIVAGVVSAELLAGPCRVTIRVGSHARRSFDVVVPNVASLSLAMLVETGIEYEPPVVSAVAGHRAAAEAAAGRAESAADDVDAAIADAAGQVVADVEADRVAAQAARAGAESAQVSAAGSASDAATSAAVAATQATLAGERAGDAGVARDAAAGSATAAASSASSAAASASDAAGSATGADAARAAAVVARTGAETARAGAEDARDAADGHADRAEQAANSFDLTATATTGAPGTGATVTVTGDGPAYGLSLTVPRGDKGDKGDKGDDGEVSQATLDAALAVKADLVDGKVPESQLPELGGSTDASLLTGALTDAVDVFNGSLTVDMSEIGGPSEFTTTVGTLLPFAYIQAGKNMTALENKADVDHTHTVADVSASGTASSSTFLRGDGTWATPPSGGSTDASLLTGALTDQVDASDAMVTFDPGGDPATMPLSSMLYQLLIFPSQVDAALGTKADAAHTHTVADVSGLSAAMDAAISAREWQGSQAAYDALGSYDPNVTYYVEE